MKNFGYLGDWSSASVLKERARVFLEDFFFDFLPSVTDFEGPSEANLRWANGDSSSVSS